MQTSPNAPNPYDTRMGSQDLIACDPHDDRASGVTTSDVRSTHDNESWCLEQNGSTNGRHGSSDPVFESDPWAGWVFGRGMQIHGQRQDAFNTTGMHVGRCAHGDLHFEIPHVMPCPGHGCPVRDVNMKDGHSCNRHVNANLDGFGKRHASEESAMFGGVPCVPSQRCRGQCGWSTRCMAEVTQHAHGCHVDDLTHRAMNGAMILSRCCPSSVAMWCRMCSGVATALRQGEKKDSPQKGCCCGKQSLSIMQVL
eukprot:6491345-Amphidinium_carterae.2